MSYSLNVIAILYMASLFLSGFVSIYSLVFFNHTRTSLLFSAFSSSLTLWVFGTLFGLLSPTLELMVFWDYFRYFWINSAAVFFLLFALSYTSFAPKLFLNPKYLSALFIPVIVDYLLIITNPFHMLFFTDISFHPEAPFLALNRSFGILNVLHSAIIASFILGGIVALVQVYRRSSHQVYRRQFQLLFAGASIFLFIVIITSLQLIPISEYIDINPISYMIACIFVLIAMSKFHFIDVIPLANKIMLANLTKTGIIATDSRNKIIEINPIAQEYLVTADQVELIGKELFSLLDSQTHFQQYTKDKFKEVRNSFKDLQINSGILKSFELSLIHPETLVNEYFQISVESIQVLESVTGFMYILRNITPEKMVEVATRKSVDFKNSLLGVISHDLRNQLFVIQGFTEVIRNELSKNYNGNLDEMIEFLEGIDAKVDEASIIIQNVRNYLKIMGSFDEPVKLTILDLRKILESVIESHKLEIEKKHLDLKLTWPQNSKKIKTLADLRVRSVFNNILDNAIKWSPDKSRIEISITKEEQFWLFTISDEGSGVPESLKDVIFKPFTSFGTEEKSGSGLGLSITTEILQAFQGTIWVENNTPTGAIFKFNLPIATSKS